MFVFDHMGALKHYEIKHAANLNHQHVITRTGRIFVLGGTFNLMNAFADNIEVSFTEEIERSPMKQGRFSFGCLEYENFIYVAGGCFSSKV